MQEDERRKDAGMFCISVRHQERTKMTKGPELTPVSTFGDLIMLPQ